MIKEPLLKSSSKAKGGFKTLPFIIANEAFEKVASYGLLPNMIIYLTREYGMETAAASDILFLWSAANYFTPIVGAFLADSYVGRYWMVGFGSITSLLGMVLLWLTTIFPKARPFCDKHTIYCDTPTTPQLLLLYSSFALMAIGAGGIRSSSLAFGVDQLNNKDDIDDSQLRSSGLIERFFSWYYLSTTVAIVVALSCVVYIQDNMGWKLGFGVPVGLMFLSAVSFFMASPFYVKLKATTSLLTGFAQVVVVSYKKRRLRVSSNGGDEIVYCHKKGSVLLVPSEKLRFLNQACIIKNPREEITPDGSPSDPWNLCTIDQIEEFKSVIKIIPMWSTGIIYAVSFSQNSIPLLQAQTMDRHITSNFEIPAGSFGTFTMIFLVIWIALYDRLLLPLASKIRRKSVRINVKHRMGIGILLYSIAIAVLAVVEIFRRDLAIKEGFSNNPRAVVKMSALWLIPRHVFSGIAMAFNEVGQNEFYYSELPKTMASISTTLAGVGMSVANLVANFIITVVDEVTKAGGHESWVTSNINRGHYDYYYWLLVGLNSTNFLYFVMCCKAYGPCEKDKRKESDVCNDHGDVVGEKYLD